MDLANSAQSSRYHTETSQPNAYHVRTVSGQKRKQNRKTKGLECPGQAHNLQTYGQRPCDMQLSGEGSGLALNCPRERKRKKSTLYIDFSEVPSAVVSYDVRQEFNRVFSHVRELPFDEFKKLFKEFQKMSNTVYRPTQWTPVMNNTYSLDGEEQRWHCLFAQKHCRCKLQCILSGKIHNNEAGNSSDTFLLRCLWKLQQTGFIASKCPSFLEIEYDASQGKVVINSEMLTHNHPLGQYEEDKVPEIKDPRVGQEPPIAERKT